MIGYSIFAQLKKRHGINQGFGLAEALVSIAIMAIVALAVFRGLRASATLNLRAHHTQTATDFGQEILEQTKGSLLPQELSNMNITSSINTAINEADPVQKTLGELGVYLEQVDATYKRADATASTLAKIPLTDLENAYKTVNPTATYDQDIFEKIVYASEGLDVGGKVYNLTLTLDPGPYSDVSKMGSSASNVFGIATVGSVDGLLFPVISEEINRYETGNGILDIMLAQIKLQDASGAYDTITTDDVYRELTKLVDVTIKDVGTSKIQVVCDLIYQAYGVEQTFNAYTGTYDLLKEDEEQAKRRDYTGWKKGGNIYIFAKAYQRSSGEFITSNDIVITNMHTGDPLNVYLVRDYYYMGDTKYGVNFDSVSMSAGGGLVVYSNLTPGQNCTGASLKTSNGCNMNLYTNIKGNNLTRDLKSADFEQAIGLEQARLRCYDVTLELTNAETGKVEAHLTSVRQIR